MRQVLQSVKKFLPQYTQAHSKPSQTSRIELFARIVNGFKPRTIFTETSILDVWLGCQCGSDMRQY